MNMATDYKEETPIVGSVDGNTDAVPGERYVVPRRSKSGRCIAIVILWVALLLLALAVLITVVVMVGFKPVIVQTTCGPVEGQKIDGIYSYKGIPFAQPPVGKLRWNPPEPIEKKCWKGTYSAKKFPAQCPQIAPSNHKFAGEEDCLYLNIYTPTSPDSNTSLPVMLYIHGGYLQFCNGSMKGYTPDERVAKSTNMVHVSIQYRLSALGFLVLDILNGTGNYGLLDQIQAIKWVRANIAMFGGNPNDITIYGQSSGGTSVWALMMSPLSKGLFQKAWALSASPIMNKTLADAKIQNEFFKSKTNCNTTECLYNLSPREIINTVTEPWTFADSNDLPVKGFFEAALLVIDGYLLPDSPFNMWKNRSGVYSDIPFVIGTTAQETDLDPAPGMKIKSWSKKDLRDYVAGKFDDFGNNITNMSLALYDEPGRDPEYIFTTMSSDLRMTCGNMILVKNAAAALPKNVYQYIITYIPSESFYPYNFPYPPKYAFHSLDLMGFYDTMGMYMPNGPSENDKRFTQTFRDQMLYFVHHGKFENNTWPPAPDNIALFSDELNMTAMYHTDKCKFWNDNNFFSYSWIN